MCIFFTRNPKKNKIYPICYDTRKNKKCGVAIWNRKEIIIFEDRDMSPKI